MAAVESSGFNVDDSINRTESVVQTHIDQSKSSINGTGNLTLRPTDRNNQVQNLINGSDVAAQKRLDKDQSRTIKSNGVAEMNGGDDLRVNNHENNDGREGFDKDMRDLQDMLSKLNPMAQEFVPPWVHNNYRPVLQNPVSHFGYVADGDFLVHSNSPIAARGNSVRRKKIGYSNGKQRLNSRTSMAQREDVIRRTVYVSDIDHEVTEEQLAALFINCGQVVDCRICGDPNSVLRFAFVEFTDEEGARNALSLAGTVLGFYPVKVLPSKTAIAPVNPTYLPRSEDEREMCARTIYCTNIDKKVTQEDIKLFFETVCGEVLRLRLLGDNHHSTRIAFVEFLMADSAIAALNCSGVVVGTLPIRVSPSKTPVRQRVSRTAMH